MPVGQRQLVGYWVGKTQALNLNKSLTDAKIEVRYNTSGYRCSRVRLTPYPVNTRGIDRVKFMAELWERRPHGIKNNGIKSQHFIN
jgi:hypothetical protein